MLPYFTETFGNPASSTHQWGWKAQEAVEHARREVAALIGASAREIYFTSGATESNNLALQGTAALADPSRRHVVVSAIEHKSVLEGAATTRTARMALYRGARGPRGRDRSGRAVAGHRRRHRTGLGDGRQQRDRRAAAAGRDWRAHPRRPAPCFMWTPRRRPGKIPIDVKAMQIDLLSLTGHKLYGPKGSGAIFVRKQAKVEPLIVGGGQERGNALRHLERSRHRRDWALHARCARQRCPRKAPACGGCAIVCCRV